MNVVYALTENYYYKLLPSVTSLVEHNPDVQVYIICETDTFPLQLPIDPVVINVSGQNIFPPDSINYNNRFTYINLLKVALASLLPDLDRVIYLDVDTIICDSLQPMWCTELTGKWFAAVDEVYGRYHPFGQHYYNMGVAVLNLAQMRADGVEPLMIEYLNTISQPWADQDAWNVYGIYNDKIASLDVRYNENCMTGTTNEPAIVHYCSIRNWYEDKTIERREYLDKYLP